MVYVDLPKGSDERSWFFALHKSIGLTMALLTMIRLVWCFTYTPPASPGSITNFKRQLARQIYWLLYVTMVIQPLSGYISPPFSGYKTKIWGLSLPHWEWKSSVLNGIFIEIHVASSVTLLCLIMLNLCCVVVDVSQGKASILRRMIPVKQ